MLPVSLDCPFLIARSVFSNVCCPRLVSCVPYVASFSGLSISDTLENTERAIRNGQSRETANIGYTGHKSRTSNIREYRTSNQKWTIQKNWQHRVHRTPLFSIVCCPRLVSCVPYVASFSGLWISDTSLWWTKHKSTIRHDPSYKKLEVKTNRTSGHHYDEPSTKTQ
jgi:hypothetical protein